MNAPRALAVLSGLCVACWAAPSAAAGDDAVEGILLEWREQPDQTPEAISSRLVACGVDAIPLLWGKWCGEGAGPEAADVASEGDDGSRRRRALELALKQQPSAAMKAFFANAFDSKGRVETARSALRFLVETSADWGPDVLRAIPGAFAGDVSGSSPGLQALYARALELALSSGSHVARWPRDWSEGLGPFLPAVVDVLVRSSGRREWRQLCQAAYGSDEVLRLVLVSLDKAPTILVHAGEGDLEGLVEASLQSGSPAVQSTGAWAARRHRFLHTAPILIQFLRDGERRVASEARRALRELFARPIPETFEAWDSWHRAEIAWWRSEGQYLETHASDRQARVAALTAAGAHPLYVRDFLPLWVETVESPDLGLRQYAAQGMADLDSAKLIALFTDRLESTEDPIREVAQVILKQRLGARADLERWHRLMADG